MIDNFTEILVSPVTKKGEGFVLLKDGELQFNEKEKFPIFKGIPILINEHNSLFRINAILDFEKTTQSNSYADTRSLKNYIRRKMLPSLSKDWQIGKRYANLAKLVENKRVLVIGAGEKIAWYKKIFYKSDVITSDVHLEFNPDIVLDAHDIPFRENSFGLVLAGQVLEHTMRPWRVAQEIERVTELNGLIHIEVPFNFPYHAGPYDFFRYTHNGLRSLFTCSKPSKLYITEGNTATIAVFGSEFLISLSKGRYMRMLLLFIGRILFGWLKYLDYFLVRRGYNISMPKGIGITFICTKEELKIQDLLNKDFNISY